jgi:hypothetical protein
MALLRAQRRILTRGDARLAGAGHAEREHEGDGEGG